MKLAIMSNRASAEGIVPDTYETSPVMLIWETDVDGIVCAMENLPPEEMARKAVEADCEAVITGRHIKRESFNIIAGACITRYDGAGLDVVTAAHRGDEGSLGIIPEYEGGPGCSAGTGSCEDGGCGVED